MRDDWQRIIASEFCSSVRDGTHDSPKPVDEGRFLVTSRHITGGRIDLANAYQISQSDFDAVNKRSQVDRWDVLISMIGTVGEPCLISEDPDFAIKNIGLFKSKGEIEGKWLYYYLLSPETQHLIREQSRGTTQQYIPLGALRNLPISIPNDRDEMSAIVHILGTLDDKIELNRKMNETLEQMARAIFKSWFVDFDPVHAKAEGRQPYGMDADTAALFPDGFEDSELGKIPRGWEVRPIDDLVRVAGGSTPRTKESSFWDRGTIAWATPKDLSSLSDPVLLSTSRQITETGLDQISSGLLAPGTVLMSSRAPVGYLAISEVPVSVNQGFIAMICDKDVPNHYILRWAQNNMSTILSNANGTTFLEISKRNFRPLPAIVPPKALLERFDVLVSPLHQACVMNLRQTHSLAETRDTLLPKLLSGDINCDGSRLHI
jgi:type I restriction enzyme, S subunit